MMMVSAKILGQVPSKSNCYQIVGSGAKKRLAKKKNLIEYENTFLIQLHPRYRNLHLGEFFKIELSIFYRSNRPDLDNALKIILDCLQMTGTIENDNKCIEIHAHKAIDKNNPRVEFTLTLV